VDVQYLPPPLPVEGEGGETASTMLANFMKQMATVDLRVYVTPPDNLCWLYQRTASCHEWRT
jgi:hypothetical protein